MNMFDGCLFHRIGESSQDGTYLHLAPEQATKSCSHEPHFTELASSIGREPTLRLQDLHVFMRIAGVA